MLKKTKHSESSSGLGCFSPTTFRSNSTFSPPTPCAVAHDFPSHFQPTRLVPNVSSFPPSTVPSPPFPRFLLPSFHRSSFLPSFGPAFRRSACIHMRALASFSASSSAQNHVKTEDLATTIDSSPNTRSAPALLLL